MIVVVMMVVVAVVVEMVLAMVVRWQYICMSTCKCMCWLGSSHESKAVV